MRNIIMFVLLLSVILLLGYHSVDAAEFFTDTSDTEQTIIARDTSASGAIYISSGKDINFDPMSILEHPDKYSEASGDLESQYFDPLIICKEMLLQMSRYCKEAEFDEPNAGPIYKAFKISGNGYAYLDRCEYYNISGEPRCLDCIISLEDYRVVYIRFYSPDGSTPASDKINSALNELKSYSDELYSLKSDLEGIIDKIYSAYWSYRSEIEYWDNGSTDYIASEFAMAFDIASDVIYTDSPVLDFWLRTMPVSLVEFYNDECVSSVLGTSYIIGKLIYDYPAVISPSYSLYNSSIYQSVYLDGYQLVTIYNIEGGYVEGYYLEPEDTKNIIQSTVETDG